MLRHLHGIHVFRTLCGRTSSEHYESHINYLQSWKCVWERASPAARSGRSAGFFFLPLTSFLPFIFVVPYLTPFYYFFFFSPCLSLPIEEVTNSPPRESFILWFWFYNSFHGILRYTIVDVLILEGNFFFLPVLFLVGSRDRFATLSKHRVERVDGQCR